MKKDILILQKLDECKVIKYCEHNEACLDALNYKITATYNLNIINNANLLKADFRALLYLSCVSMLGIHFC